jgi:hypothetical protein
MDMLDQSGQFLLERVGAPILASIRAADDDQIDQRVGQWLVGSVRNRDTKQCYLTRVNKEAQRH